MRGIDDARLCEKSKFQSNMWHNPIFVKTETKHRYCIYGLIIYGPIIRPDPRSKPGVLLQEHPPKGTKVVPGSLPSPGSCPPPSDEDPVSALQSREGEAASPTSHIYAPICLPSPGSSMGILSLELFSILTQYFSTLNPSPSYPLPPPSPGFKRRGRSKGSLAARRFPGSVPHAN